MAWTNKDVRGTYEGAAAEAITENDLVGRDASGTIELPNAAVGTATFALGFAAMKDYAVGEKVAIVRTGRVKGLTDDASAALTVGALYYLSETTAGKITATAPSTVGDVVQVVGVASATDTLEVMIGIPQVVASSGTWLTAK